MKKLFNASIVYALLGLSSGVFYREFTKILGYTERTRLSLLHGHYVSLGVFFFLILVLFENQFNWLSGKKSKGMLWGYHIGLNISALGFLLRGLTEVLSIDMTKGLNASISGISGIGHILLAVSMVMILVQLKKGTGE